MADAGGAERRARHRPQARTPHDRGCPRCARPAEGSFPDPAASADQSDASDRLYAALRRLPEIDRALVLLVLEERIHAEIADVLGLSTGNVAVRLHRAKARLASLLSDTIPS